MIKTGISMLLEQQNVPTSYHLFYNTFDANVTANDCRKKDDNIF
jgi:hypothetical protein